MTYTVHSIFKTIQGEGSHSGRVAVFCRFAGCNLWSGREQDRADAVCKFCDTEFVGGTKYETSELLADEIERTWGHKINNRMVVLTGGEPSLQYDNRLSFQLKKRGFYIAIETNGSTTIDGAVDWICVSPKPNTKRAVSKANELKFVFPQDGYHPQDAAAYCRADYYLIQPMDGPRLQEATAAAVEFVLANPHWRLGIQAHKQWGVE